MRPLDEQQQAARDWFESLRDRICAAFEEIEREAGSDAAFAFTPWERTDASGEPGGGGVRGQMSGKVFEKVGINVSTVGGQFAPEFATSIPGAEDDPAMRCSLLSDQALSTLVQSEGASCEDAIQEMPLGSGDVVSTEVWGEEAQVKLSDDTLFLTRTADGWRVAAAACRSQGPEQPYECQVEAS